jgi:hypothetical protein
MPLYRPRLAARLTVPIAGSGAAGGPDETITLPLAVRRAAWLSNDHNHADTLELTVDWMQAGVDPRLLADGSVVLYLGSADAGGNWTPSEKDIRFVGIMKRPRRSGDGGEGLVVEMLFHDFTTLFLESTRFPSSGVPDLTDDLATAWRKICAHTGLIDPTSGELRSTVTALADRLRFVGVDSPPVLARAVAQRFKRLGKVQVKPDADAWAVWQQCVGMCGLISFIRLDECIVTTATDYYTAKNPPRLIWGGADGNILRISEERDTRLSGAGIGITSFDPLRGTTIEALWPPVGDVTIRRKHINAKRAHSEDSVRQAEAREYFAYPGITDEATLLDIAKRVYEERSRQDLEGTLVTSEMSATTVTAAQFDLLTLSAGDVIRLEIDRGDTERLGQLRSDEERMDHLVGRGYSAEVATLIVRTLASSATKMTDFFVKRVSVRLESSPEGGTFEVDINFCNRLDVNGNAK